MSSGRPTLSCSVGTSLTDQVSEPSRLDAAEVATCLPHLPGVDWGLLRETLLVFVGVGAIGRALAMSMAYLGMRRCVLIDPKRGRSA
ncbi:MAG: hypothetical protein GXY83_24770 [Rhodopirellula sp.]|nr:hypothetical protein [Rhodopirellula sp.]